ncbi:ABC transporter permease [Salinispira pacifica]|uniref:ABC transporter, permease protein n=1 Tax=Salinispira pacifica TaxID=1307761 RepID=V5WJR7_9SPIO|nr:FtsX-like permease family protein [Salinispira pacifica]AHC15900.1 ABC transporter, permease protein [Salinispira pacifica]
MKININFYLKLAWLNLLRHKRRTVITSISIAAGIMAYVYMDSMVLGMVHDNSNNLILYETASVRMVTPEFWEDREFYPLKHAIDSPRTIMGELEAAGFNPVPRTRFSGEMLYYQDPYPDSGSRRIIVNGVDPEKDGDVFRIDSSVSQGQWLESETPSAVIGAGIARKTGARVGYPLLIRTRTRDGAYQTIEVIISGIADTPNPVVDLSAVYIPLSLADSALNMNGAVTDLNLYHPPTSDPGELKRQLEELLPGGILARTWQEMEPAVSEFDTIARNETKAFTFFIFIVALVGISNTMLNAVYDRFREIGMLRAMGMEDRSILLLLTLEAGGIGLLGAIAGVLFSIPIVWHLVTWGLDFSAFMPSDLNFGFRTDMHFMGMWNFATMLRAAAFGIAVSALVALIPGRRAVKKPVVDCLRME